MTSQVLYNTFKELFIEMVKKLYFNFVVYHERKISNLFFISLLKLNFVIELGRRFICDLK